MPAAYCYDNDHCDFVFLGVEKVDILRHLEATNGGFPSEVGEQNSNNCGSWGIYIYIRDITYQPHQMELST